MSKLVFKAADVRRVVEHTLANAQSEYVVDYRDDKLIKALPDAPAVLLVHDDGIYLMSNGNPRDIVMQMEWDNKPGEGRSFCTYAKGCHPENDADFYDTARALVGGDDFGECLPWAREIKAQIDGGAAEIAIWFSGNQIRLLPPTRPVAPTRRKKKA